VDHRDEERGVTVWLTGLPCSGKSTLALMLEDTLRRRGRRVEVLDGDVVRTQVSRGLGFSREDRDSNVLRIGYVAGLLAKHGVWVIVAAVSPYAEARQRVREQLAEYVEVYLDCPLEECERRDVKGLYAKARAGSISGFTGVSDPYEPPLHPELTLHTLSETPEECVRRVLSALMQRGYLSGERGPVASYRT
jgi:adenylylsulfate kinase